MSIIDLDAKLDGKVILGITDNLIRLDRKQTPVLQKSIGESEGNSWFPKEVDFNHDDWGQLSEAGLWVALNTVGYQTIMDSGVTNGYLEVVLPIITDSEWKEIYARIGIEENIHAKSYSTGLNLVFNDSSKEKLDSVLAQPFIRKRMDHEIDAFGEVDKFTTLLKYKKLTGIDPAKDQEFMHKYRVAIVKMFINAYLLEGIKFPFSFLQTFTVNKTFENAIQGFNNLIKLIAHDELTFHVPTNLRMMKHLRRSEHEGFKYLFDESSKYFDDMSFADWTVKQVETICNEELEFSDFLLQKGEFVGCTSNIHDHFIKHHGNLRLAGLKLPGLYDKKKYESNDIVKWYNKTRDINQSNSAGQETDTLTYVKGGLKNDLVGNNSVGYYNAR